jgi:hypothetical protein
MKLIQLVDSLSYVQGNCYQHQLLTHLKRQFNHTILSINELEKLRFIESDVVTLSTVKIRNVYRHLDRLKQTLGQHKIYIYDQDPWESFIDGCTYPRGYGLIKKELPGAEFIVTSGWWANYIQTKNLPTHFCRVWMLPEYCSQGRVSNERIKGLSFRGQLHPFRAAGIQELKNRNVTVDVLSGTTSYVDWLIWLQTRQAFFHDESNDWTIEGISTPKQCAVLKDVEIASQGCFVFRDSKSLEEIANYGADKIPCIVTYDSYDHCVERLRWLQSLSEEQTDEMIQRSVKLIKSVGGWIDMSKIIEGKMT